jgi:hypothetical protein
MLVGDEDVLLDFGKIRLMRVELSNALKVCQSFG